MSTAIEWTDVTDNIIVVEGGGWWCRMISEGCVNCYAARLNQNDFFGGNHLPYTGTPPKLVLREELMRSWARQRKPKRHFVASMTDVFGEWVPIGWIFGFLDYMAGAPEQTFQVLTKRADRMRAVVTQWLEAGMRTNVPMHIWLGVSVENQARADERIPELLKIPAVRFLSCEPLLGPLDLLRQDYLTAMSSQGRYPFKGVAQENRTKVLHQIDWVICGGESGPGARPLHPDWARSLRDQCVAAGVPFFFKQWGEWAPGEDDWGDYGREIHFQEQDVYDRVRDGKFGSAQIGEMHFGRVGKHAAGRLLDGREWSEFPQTEVGE